MYIPIDRRQALLHHTDLPNRAVGTVLFADLSDFTGLTETFFKVLGPKRGVEQLTTQLNAMYGTLIDLVIAYRGSVVGFGGDALTCWFDSDNGQHAAACALHMQRAMAAWATIEINHEQTASFAVKVALAYGSVRRFVVGDPQIQLLDTLAGATLQRVMAAEQFANRGEIVASRELVAIMGEAVHWRATTQPEFVLITGIDQQNDQATWHPSAAELPAEQARPWVLAPVYEHVRRGQSQFLAEIRPIVALFMRFDGLDYDHDDDAGATIDALTRRVQHIVNAAEGTLLQLVIGDKGQYIYAIWGAPLAHEDDAVRAVQAALDLRTLPTEFAFLGKVQIGISQGRMLIGSYGNASYRTYSALGDEANVAARLMMQAEPDQILVSQHIADVAAEMFNVTPLAPIVIKGKQAPLPVALVHGRRQIVAPSAHRTAPTLVGRERELAQLAENLAAMQQGHGQIVVVEGEAGVGKSQIASAVLHHAAAAKVRCMYSVCQSTDRQSAYVPWRQILRAMFALEDASPDVLPRKQRRQQLQRIITIVSDLNPAWLDRVPLLSAVLELTIPDNTTTAAFDARLRKEALVSFVLDLLQAWTRTHPTLLVIEDTHWLDEASLALTLAFSRVLDRLPVMLLLTQRPPTASDSPLAPLQQLAYHTFVPVRELDPSGVKALLEQRLGSGAPQLLVDVIQARAQGNPFFVGELLAVLQESGRLTRQPDGSWHLADAMMRVLREANCLVMNAGEWTLAAGAPLGTVYLGLPDSVRGIVLARIDRLPEAHKLTLKVASTIGHVFEFALLHQAHPLQLDETVLYEQLHLLESLNFTIMELPGPQWSYVFKHNIIQEVAYETLLEAQQQELHGAVGRTLQHLHPEAVEQLAHHYSLSGQRDHALWYLELAGHKAQRAYANETALGYYSRALAFAERWPWRKGQIEILHLLGRRAEQFTALRALPNDPEVPMAEVAFQWGLYYQVTSDYVQAEMYLQRALESYRTDVNPVGELLTLRELGMIGRLKGEYDRAKTWYQEGLQTFSNRRFHLAEEKQAFAQLLFSLGTVYRQKTMFNEATEYYNRALEIYRETGNRWGEAEVINGLGGISYYQRFYRNALNYYEQALTIYRSLGDRSKEGTSVYNVGLVLQELGEYTDAQANLEQALNIQKAIGNRLDEVNTWNVIGTLHQLNGDSGQAERCFMESLRLSQMIGAQSGETYALANLGALYCDMGDFQLSEQHLTQALVLAHDDPFITSYCMSHLGSLMLSLKRLDQAIIHAENALHLRRESALDLWTTFDLATLAAAYLAQNQVDQGLNYAQQAVKLLDQHHDEGLESPGRDYFVCGNVFAAVGATELARQAFGQATAIIQQQADRIPDEQQRHKFLTNISLHREIMQYAHRN